MIELNLLPDIKQEFVQARRQKRLVVASMFLLSLASIGVVALLAFYAFAGQSLRQKLADDDIKKYSNQLNQKDNLVRDLTIQNQLASITELHKTKGEYGRIFDYLKTLNPAAPNEVKIFKAVFDTTTNSILIEASAKDFSAISVFKETLKNAKIQYKDPLEDNKQKTTRMFTGITISDAGLGKDSAGNQVASFKAQVIYDPVAFDWTVKNPVLQVPKGKTNQSASQVSVFAETPPAVEGSTP